MLCDYVIVKVFSDNILYGNPAAVIFLESELEKSIMQRIAKINGFPETVFLLKPGLDDSNYLIWWFTPEHEVYDAGHATLAAQYSVAYKNKFNYKGDEFTLKWDYGNRTVVCGREKILDYRQRDIADLVGINMPIPELADKKTFEAGNDLVLLLEDRNAIQKYKPNLSIISALKYRGLAITSSDKAHDYCSRFFAPKYGVDEDFVTASSHVYLSKYWMNKNNLNTCSGVQLSPSSGVVKSTMSDESVYLEGDCCVYAEGVMHI